MTFVILMDQFWSWDNLPFSHLQGYSGFHQGPLQHPTLQSTGNHLVMAISKARLHNYNNHHHQLPSSWYLQMVHHQWHQQRHGNFTWFIIDGVISSSWLPIHLYNNTWFGTRDTAPHSSLQGQQCPSTTSTSNPALPSGLKRGDILYYNC